MCRRSPSTAICVSSASALAWAAANIKAGDGDLYLVGGTENMTRAPWALQNGRSGYRMGMPTDKMYDTLVWTASGTPPSTATWV